MQFEWQWQNSQKSRVTEKRKSLEIGKNRNQGYKLSLKVLHSLLESKLWNKLNLTVHFLDNDKMTIFRNFFISGNTIKLPKTVLNSHEEFEKIQENEKKDPIDRSVKNFPCIICKRVFFPVPSLESGSRVCIDICTDGTYGSRGDKEKEKEKEKGGHHPSMISEGFMHGDGGVDEENEGGISDTRNRMWFCPTSKCGGASHIYCLATAGDRTNINGENDHKQEEVRGRDGGDGGRGKRGGGMLNNVTGKEAMDIEIRENRIGRNEIEDYGGIVESTNSGEIHPVVRRESMVPSWGVCRKCGERAEWVKIISDVCIKRKEEKQKQQGKKQGKMSSKDSNNESVAVHSLCDKPDSNEDSDRDVEVDRENDDYSRNNNNNHKNNDKNNHGDDDDDDDDDDDFRFDDKGIHNGKRSRENDDSDGVHFSNTRRSDEWLNSFYHENKRGTETEVKAKRMVDRDKSVGIGRIVINIDSDSDDDADEGDILFIGDSSEEKEDEEEEDYKEMKEKGNKNENNNCFCHHQY